MAMKTLARVAFDLIEAFFRKYGKAFIYDRLGIIDYNCKLKVNEEAMHQHQLSNPDIPAIDPPPRTPY